MSYSYFIAIYISKLFLKTQIYLYLYIASSKHLCEFSFLLSSILVLTPYFFILIFYYYTNVSHFL